MQYKKAANTVGIFATSCEVTFSRLVTKFCCGHNVRRIAKGDCLYHNIQMFILNY